MMKQFWAILALLLVAGVAQAQVPAGGIAIHGRGWQAAGDSISVRCRNTADSAFEACGGGAGGGDGSIVDGVNTAIKATVFDYTNANPLAAQLVDSNGDPVSVGGGTQYAQGSAATDTDQMMMAGCVRADTAAVATGVIDGDRARCIVDSTGRLWVNVGASALPTGAATAANQTTIIGHVDGLEALLAGTLTISGTVTVTDGAGALNVIVDSSALPSGAATSANQTTIIGHVDGIEGLLATIDADTGTIAANILTDTQLRATPVPVSGTVTVTDGAGALNVIVDSSALPSGASSAANQTTIIGHVDGLEALLAGTLTVGGTVTVTDGAGALNVICDSGCGGAASFEDDDVFTATTTPVNIMGALYDTTPAAITDGSAGAVRMNSSRVLMVDGSGVTQPISAASLPLPTGASTSANQTTIIGHVDGLEGLLTTIDADTGNIATSVATIAGAVSGTEMQVDVLTMPNVTIGTFPDNEPFNVAQINGVTVLMGAGNTGTGSQRVTIASDQAPVTVRAGNSNAIISCTNNSKLNMTTATTTEIVALSGSTRIYVCSFSIMTSAATNVKFVDGTGSNCATSQSDVSSNMHFLTTMPGIARGSGQGMILKTSTDGDALCVTSSSAVNVDIDVSWTQF